MAQDLELAARAKPDLVTFPEFVNATGVSIEQAVIQLNVNKPVANVALSSDIIGTRIPPFRYNPRARAMEITIPSLGPGESLSLFVDYDEVTL